MLILVFTYLTAVKFTEPEPDRSKFPRVQFGSRSGANLAIVEGAPKFQRFMVATFLWESTLAGLRSFIMLYFIYSLHTLVVGSLLLGYVGVTYMVAGVASGLILPTSGDGRDSCAMDS